MRRLGRLKTLRRFVQIAGLAFAALCNVPNANAGFTFTPGHIYSTFSNIGSRDIFEYSETGTFLGSLTPLSLIEDDELRGIAFGPDGFLYAVKLHFAQSGFSVLALDTLGNVYATYPMDGIYVFGDLASGKIALDQQYIYVAGGVLVRFTVGDPNSGVVIYHENGAVDVKILPNGHLLVAYPYGVDEITNEGTIVRSIPLIGANWGDVQGIEYDPATDKLFATELGYSGFKFQLMRVNASTGVLEDSVYFVYGEDLFLTRGNTLLVGSSSQAPGIFDENLASIGTLDGVERFFVTQYPTGETTPTPTPSATPTPTPSPTPCKGRCSPTPRPRPTPAPRP